MQVVFHLRSLFTLKFLHRLLRCWLCIYACTLLENNIWSKYSRHSLSLSAIVHALARYVTLYVEPHRFFVCAYFLRVRSVAQCTWRKCTWKMTLGSCSKTACTLPLIIISTSSNALYLHMALIHIQTVLYNNLLQTVAFVFTSGKNRPIKYITINGSWTYTCR